MVSTENAAAIQAVYYSAYGFGPFAGPTNPFYVQLSGTFPNGTAWGDFVAPTTGLGTVMDVPSLATEGTDGVWPGVGGWNATGVTGAASYAVTFNLPDITGQLNLKQIAPSRYPCNE